MKKPGCIAVIPARYQSMRFPGKPLAQILGKPMVQWVYEQTAAASAVDQVCVATDDERIATAVRAFGGEVVMTRSDHPSGSDRVAEVVHDRDPAVVINVQGDEPLVTPDVIDRLVEVMYETDTPPEMATLAVSFARDGDRFRDPNNVKVVLDAQGNALYFSRAAVPYKAEGGIEAGCLWHWGIYAYQGWYIRRFVSLGKGRLEGCEKLEQLRALEDGARIRVVNVEADALDVNVPADVPLVEQVLSQRGSNDA